MRKTKNNIEIHSSTWPWKEFWLFMKVKWNFRLLDNFFFYKNLTFPPFHNFLLCGIPSHPSFKERVSEQRDEQRNSFLAPLLILKSFVFPYMAYFERVLFPLNKGGKGWMGGCNDIGNLNIRVLYKISEIKRNGG